MTRNLGITAFFAALLLPIGVAPASAGAQGYEAPPPMASESPPPPQVERQPAAPAGQWVTTQQYGLVWIPYSDAYAYSPPGGYGEPQQYVYYPSYGWTWVVAPWIWGYGPWPTFGLMGPRHFGWYGHGWWRTPSRWHYAPSRQGPGFDRGFRPGASHAGFGGVRSFGGHSSFGHGGGRGR